MAAPAATLTGVRHRLIDLNTASNPNWVDSTTLQTAVDMALAKYSKDRPRVVTEDEVGTGSPYFVLVGTGAVLASWVDQFSTIQSIEYPAETPSATYVPSYLINGEDYQVGYRATDKVYLRLITVNPPASETLRITYTTPHTHTTVTDTVYAQDVEALRDLAAHFACLEMATKQSGSNSPIVSADSVNYRDGQLRYTQMAKEWLNAYNAKMGIPADGSGSGGGSGSTPGSSALADWDGKLQSGLPFITHWGRRR